mmetsp:Transcript_16851/g.46053  ORF Transcript_16851/g.46053 Transcript_16851/m.46053 type:complete len:109 (+) Transcript_16851:229-555(+)
MLSAWRMVESRCATTTTVRPPMSESSAACTTCSLWASRADVASSSSRMRGFATMARAMAMRCFCPPLSCVPRSPHSVSNLPGSSSMKAWALACCAAALISSSVAVSLP